MVETLQLVGDLDVWDLLLRAACGARYARVYVSGERSAADLYRVLALAAPLVRAGGAITVAAYAKDLAGETRLEATEVFLGVHAGWERSVDPRTNAIALRRVAEAAAGGVVEAAAEMPERPPAGAVGKRVVSLSVFGDCRLAPEGSQHRLAERYLAVFVRAHAALFPGYELRVHHDEALYAANYGAVLKALERRGLVNLVYVPSRPGRGKCERMLDRLRPLWDEGVDYVFCRDVDSLPTWRERMVAEEFIVSGAAAGVIHDNVMHTGLMGGLCHFDARQFRTAFAGTTFGDLVASAGFDDERWSRHGADQDALNALVAPRMPSILEHQIFDARGEGGERVLRPSTWPQSRVVREIAEPPPRVIDDVNPRARSRSGEFTNYIGAAGYRVNDALAFYDKSSPVSELIRGIEEVYA